MSYRPDETTLQIYAEGAWLQGAIVTAVLYGVVIVLSLTCWSALWSRIRSHDSNYTKNVFFFCYVSFLFLIGTVYVVANSQVTQLGFINNRLYPGGPSAYEENTASLPLNIAFVLSSWCADLLMVWRCFVVYRNTKAHRAIVALGSTLFVAAVVTGTLWLVVVSSPSPPTSGWMSFSFLFPYLSVDLAINIFISLLTVLRLLFHRHRISNVLGPGHGAIYASLAVIITESASVYSICSLLYLIPYALNSPLAYAFMQILGEAQTIAPLLIIHRIVEGKGWADPTTHPASTAASVQMRRMTYPRTSPPPMNVEITFHTESTHDGSFLNQSGYAGDHKTSTHASVVSPV